MVLQRYTHDFPIKDLIFRKATFWVQVHNIPISFMTKKVVEEICECKSRDAVDNEGGHCIRVRVIIDISLPLCRGRLVTLEIGNKMWVEFKYERLPNMCYWCGRLNHEDKNCDLWILSKGSLMQEQK